VHPSLTAADGGAEGTPTVITAAAACGMPVISTWHAGIPEIVSDEESGFLVAENDVDALTERMLYLTDHPELWNPFGRAGRRRIEEGFSREALACNLENLYDTLLEGLEKEVAGEEETR